MKNSTVTAAIAIALLAGAAAGCTTPPPAPRSNTQASAAAPASEAQTKTVRIPIDGMSCSACVARIKSGLSELDGVSSVDVDLASRSARVRFVPSRLSAEAIVAAIDEMGYRAGPAADSH